MTKQATAKEKSFTIAKTRVNWGWRYGGIFQTSDGEEYHQCWYSVPALGLEGIFSPSVGDDFSTVALAAIERDLDLDWYRRNGVDNPLEIVLAAKAVKSSYVGTRLYPALRKAGLGILLEPKNKSLLELAIS